LENIENCLFKNKWAFIHIYIILLYYYKINNIFRINQEQEK
jgi:hypothetical protein